MFMLCLCFLLRYITCYLMLRLCYVSVTLYNMLCYIRCYFMLRYITCYVVMLYNMLSYAMLYNMLCCVMFILRYKGYNVCHVI